MIVYQAKHKPTGRIYVGATTKTVQKREQSHWKARDSLKNKQRQFYIDLRNDRSSFEWSILEKIKGDLNDLANAERKWIAYYKDNNFALYNKKLGGDFLRPHSPEALERITKWAKGRKHSQESKKKVSEALKGRKFSEDHKRNLSDAHKDKRIFAFRNKKTNQLFLGTQYELRAEFDLDSGHLSKVIFGKANQHKGWIIEKRY